MPVPRCGSSKHHELMLLIRCATADETANIGSASTSKCSRNLTTRTRVQSMIVGFYAVTVWTCQRIIQDSFLEAAASYEAITVSCCCCCGCCSCHGGFDLL